MDRRKMKKFFVSLVIIGGVMGSPFIGKAAEYPNRPIEVVVPFGAGSLVDRILLMMIPYLEKELGQKVLPNYKSGAGGSIGVAWLAKVKPDGYNLGIAAPGPILIRPLTTQLTYGMKDLIPIAQIGQNYTFIWVGEHSKWKTAQELFADVRQNPEKFTFGTAGAFSVAHLGMEGLKLKADLKVKHVPFESSHKCYLALLGKQVDFIVTELPRELIRGGKVIPLAVFTEKRVNEFPNIPTLKELGYEVRCEVWYCMIAPQGTPQTILNRWERAIQKTVENPEFQNLFLQNIGIPVSFLGGKEMAVKWERDLLFIKEVVEKLNIK